MLTLQIIIIVILVLFNAFLAASEMSIVSARKPWLRLLSEEGNGGARRALGLAETPSRFLATVQVGMTLAAFFTSAVGAVSLVNVFTGWLDVVPLNLVHNNSEAIALIAGTAILSFISIVFGELIPKTIAVHQAEAVAMRISRPVEIVAKITRPLALVLTYATNLMLRLFGVDARASLPSVTRDELLAMLGTAEDEGIVEATDADLIEGAFEFGDTVARSVMVPRVDVGAVEGATPLHDVVDRFFATGFSRMPVYRETLDDVIGILHVKDVFRVLLKTGDGSPVTASDIMRPAYFVPESKPIDELLSELQTRRTQIAIVIDEFGGVAGLVTLEDVIEELVGEIADEFDPGYEPFQFVGPDQLDVDGRVPIDDLLDRLELDRDELNLEFEAESVGGLISYLLGRIPLEGDVIHAGPLRLEVDDMNGNRVRKVRVDIERPGGEDANTSDVVRGERG
ncbi:MAG TPA: hemolysin family protein [Nitrolancea sp.]